jgi:two-component system KDP operon response regulator KdpE
LVREPPDALVIDLGADDAEQQAALWRLRAALDLPTVAITSQHGGECFTQILQRGADTILHGPATPQVIAAAVGALLRRIRPNVAAAAPVIHLGDVEIDLVHRVVRRDGKVLTLSRTEFSLLSALVRANGRVCTQHELLAEVWGAERTSESHYLRLYIRYLREKIELDPSHPCHIVTVRGVGYRFVKPDGVRNEAAIAEAIVATATAPAEGSRLWNAHSSSSPAIPTLPPVLKALTG